MTTDERAARIERIRQANIASNGRVNDFIELIARMCAETTARKKPRGNPAPASSVLLEVHVPVRDREERSPASSQL